MKKKSSTNVLPNDRLDLTRNHSFSSNITHQSSFIGGSYHDILQPNAYNVIIDEDDEQTESSSSVSKISYDDDSMSCMESISSDIMKHHCVPTVQARKIRLAKLTSQSNYGKSDPVDVDMNYIPKPLVSLPSTSSVGSIDKSPIRFNPSYVVGGGGGRKKDYTSYFMSLDHDSFEEMHNHDTSDSLDKVTKDLELTKCVSYLSSDAISWMNKRRPNAINDKSLHYSHITPSRALQLLAIFKGLDYDNSGKISKKEFEDALSYVNASSKKNQIIEQQPARKSSTISMSNGGGGNIRRTSINRDTPSILTELKMSLPDKDSVGKGRKSSVDASIRSKPTAITSSSTSMMKNSLAQIFESMDIDGDGMVDFNEFVVQLTSSKNTDEIDNERIVQAFFEFATSHQRHTIIDSLNDKDNKLNDVQKYYQLRKLFKMDTLRQDTNNQLKDNDKMTLSNDKMILSLNQKRNYQRRKEQQRARYALSSLRSEKQLQMIQPRDLIAFEHRFHEISTSMKSVTERKLKAVEDLDMEMKEYMHSTPHNKPNIQQYPELSLLQSFASVNMPKLYHKTREVADEVLKKMSVYPIPKISTLGLKRFDPLQSKTRTRVLEELCKVRENSTTYGHHLPPLKPMT